MLAGRRKQENIEMVRPKGISEWTMTALLQDMKMTQGCLAPKELILVETNRHNIHTGK